MYGFLKGTLISKELDGTACVLDTGQVGYEIQVPKPIWEKLETETTYAFWIHTVVRETSIQLFGFRNETEKQFFKLLLGVTGLGPKSALALLGEHGAEPLAQLILSKQAKAIASAPGIGKKTAERIVLELGSKVEKLQWIEKITSSKETKSAKDTPTTDIRSDLYSALSNLGYAPNAIKLTLAEVLSESEAADTPPSFEITFKKALNQLSGHTIVRET